MKNLKLPQKTAKVSYVFEGFTSTPERAAKANETSVTDPTNLCTTIVTSTHFAGR